MPDRLELGHETFFEQGSKTGLLSFLTVGQRRRL